MSKLYEAEKIRDQILGNRHYKNSSCFSTSSNYYYNEFCSKRDLLLEYRNLYTIFELMKNDIISTYNDIEYKKNELENNRKNYEKQFNNLEEKLAKEKEINHQQNENQLIQAKNNYDNEELYFKNLVERLDMDISNLNQEISKLNEKFNEEIDLKKKEVLFKIANEYKLKLIQYKNSKELENQRKQNEYLIKKAQFKAKKKIELEDLKNKSEFVQKLMFMMKNISLNMN